MAQLVAHLLCKQRVVGSSPIASTRGQRPFSVRWEGPLSCRYPSKVLQCGHLQPLARATVTPSHAQRIGSWNGGIHQAIEVANHDGVIAQHLVLRGKVIRQRESEG